MIRLVLGRIVTVIALDFCSSAVFLTILEHVLIS